MTRILSEFLDEFTYALMLAYAVRINEERLQKEKAAYEEIKKLLPSPGKAAPQEMPQQRLQVMEERKIQPVPEVPKPIQEPLTTGTALDEFLNNPSVKAVELFEGNVWVKTEKGIEDAHITLSNEDAHKVIEKFSKATRIPVLAGVFRSSYRDFIIDAILVNELNPRLLIIRK